MRIREGVVTATPGVERKAFGEGMLPASRRGGLSKPGIVSPADSCFEFASREGRGMVHSCAAKPENLEHVTTQSPADGAAPDRHPGNCGGDSSLLAWPRLKIFDVMCA